jgi:hypothetical protein
MRLVQRRPRPGACDSGATLHLRIAGFAGAGISPEEVLAALEPVPDLHLAGLLRIEFAPEQARFFPSSLVAAYLQRERCICFYRLPPWPMFRHVLHHEIGHHVFALIISSKVKTQWTQRAFRRSAPGSAYGASSPAEDFAECYARHLRFDPVDAAFAAKEAFMRELVFSGAPWTLKEHHLL